MLVHADREKGVSYWGKSRAALVAAAIDADRLVRARPGGSPAFRGLMFEHAEGLEQMLRA
jgi:hypothetical protein